jgi:hypothetical protein
MRLGYLVVLLGFIGALGCSKGVAHTGDRADLGEPCESDADCASGQCIPYAGGQICSQPCDQATPCTNDTACRDYADATWCLPGCTPDCAGRCCGDDGCGGTCADACPGQCNPSSCECEYGCESEGETRACTAASSCPGTETCQSDLTWSACANEQWACTDPGTEEACDVGQCPGVRQCESDCQYGDCLPNCPTDTDCCADGCVDLDTDRDHCGACDRACLLYLNSEVPTDPCYSGACVIKCCRNGNETCDDEHFIVPSPYVPMYLVCTNGNGGVAYVATDTGPQCTDGIRRCRCWDEAGLDFQDYLPSLYIDHMTCDFAGKIKLVDLSAYANQGLYVGAHEQLDGSGHMTRACIATGP